MGNERLFPRWPEWVEGLIMLLGGIVIWFLIIKYLLPVVWHILQTGKLPDLPPLCLPLIIIFVVVYAIAFFKS